MAITHSSDDASSDWLTWSIALGAGLVVRAARGYRSFPSVDDFMYVPIAQAQFDATAFPRDTFVQEFISHTPFWPWLVRLLGPTLGLPLGLWLITIVLSIGTSWAALRWMRALGGSGMLLPVTALLAFAAKLPGLGRGEFDGVFGDAFHMQWLALCVLLWTYDAVLRENTIAAGVLLGIVAMCHPVVAAHGALAVACAILFSGAGRFKRLLCVATLSFVVSSFVSIPLLWNLRNVNGGMEAARFLEIAELGFLFRTVHEFEIETRQFAIFVLIASAGLVGVSSLFARGPSSSVTMFLGLLIGHILLLGSVGLFHTELVGDAWMAQTSVPFQLHLTRTTPVLLLLASVALVTALEREFLEGGRRPDGARSIRIGWLAFWALSGITLVFLLVACVQWNAALLVVFVGGSITAVAARRPAWRRQLALVWCLAAAGGLGWFGYASQQEAEVSDRDQRLYEWVQASTAKDALFIIPPGHLEFRYYAQRSIYIDFKLVPSSAPARMLPWRQRLEEVALPDKIAAKSRGWKGIAEWDRTYANRNTPTRMARLLQSTQADYFLWDERGRDMPPYVSIPWEEDSRVSQVYDRDGYKVFRLLATTPEQLALMVDDAIRRSQTWDSRLEVTQ